jgi:hypothetical protein
MALNQNTTPASQKRNKRVINYENQVLENYMPSPRKRELTKNQFFSQLTSHEKLLTFSKVAHIVEQ